MQILFLLFLTISFILWIYGGINLFIIFKLAKKNEVEFFSKYVEKQVWSKNEFTQFWKLMRRGKVPELRHIWLQKKVNRLKFITKMYLLFFCLMVVLLVYIWTL